MENKKKPGSNKSKPNKKKTSTVSSKDNKYIAQYEAIINVLSVIFLNEKTINFLKTSKDFQKIIIKLISIAQVIENKYKISCDNNISNSIAAYENITATKFTSIDYNFSSTNKTELEITDEINYVKIFLLNSLGINWDDLIASKKSEEAIKEAIVANKQTNGQKQADVETVDASKLNDHQPYKNAEDFLSKNNISLEEVANNIARQQAQFLLQKDIINNKFYQFDSKPKFFPTAKYIMYGLWALFMLCYFLYSVFSLLLNGKPYQFTTFESPINTQDKLSNFLANTINYGSASIFSIILVVVVMLFLFITIYQLLKNRKNDNVRYSFKSFISWLILFFSLVSLLIPLTYNSNLSILGTFEKIKASINLAPQSVTGETVASFSFTFNNAQYFPFYYGYYVLTIMLIITICLVFIGTVALMIIKPKLDVNRINQKISQYYDDIINNRISIDDNNGSNSFSNSFSGGWGPRNPFSPF